MKQLGFIQLSRSLHRLFLYQVKNTRSCAFISGIFWLWLWSLFQVLLPRGCASSRQMLSVGCQEHCLLGEFWYHLTPKSSNSNAEMPQKEKCHTKAISSQNVRGRTPTFNSKNLATSSPLTVRVAEIHIFSRPLVVAKQHGRCSRGSPQQLTDGFDSKHRVSWMHSWPKLKVSVFDALHIFWPCLMDKMSDL